MSEKVLYVHCGYPKTATTTLQKWVYPNIPAIKYVGRTYQESGRSQIESEIMSGIRLISSVDERGIYHKGNEHLKELSVDASKVLISLEGILAQCLVPAPAVRFSNNVDSAPSLRQALTHVRLFAAEAGFDTVKPIVTLRKQGDLLSSFFAEGYMDRYSRISEICTFEKFIDVLISGHGCVDSNVVNYCALEADLIDVFGEGNYQFLFFKWIKESPELFSQTLGDFIGVDASSIHDSLTQSVPENVRRSQGAKTQLKIRRKNARYYLDRTKKLLMPNRSLGLGRHLGSVLAKFEYGPAVLEPSEEALSRIRKFYHSSNHEFVKRHPEFSALLDV